MAQHSILYKLWLFSRQWFVYWLVQSQRVRLWGLRNRMTRTPKIFLTVAFNQPHLIRLQLESLRLFAPKDALIVVIDASLTRVARTGIHAACERYSALYVRGPWNLFSYFQGSLSHSSTLDWFWHGALRKATNSVVAFLDHDVFLVQTIDEAYFSAEVRATGRKEERAGKWYLWPGLLFLPIAQLTYRGATFMPFRELDSGGGLWLGLYRQHPETDFRFLSREFFEVADGSRVEASSVEVIDGRWVHLIDGSGWLDGTGKFDKVFGDGFQAPDTQLREAVENLRSKGVNIPSL